MINQIKHKKILIENVSQSKYYKVLKNYSKKKEMPYTLNRSAYNIFSYAIKLLENDKKYKKFKAQQFKINQIIFDTQKNLMKKKLKSH